MLCEQLTAEAQALVALPEANLVRQDDPRFAKLMAAIDPEARTARELGLQLIGRSRDPSAPAETTSQLRQLREMVEGMPCLTVEAELTQIFAVHAPARNREILVGYYGWADGRQHTLNEIGERFGITRERIRQVCAKLTRKHKRPASILAPAMDRALALIEQRLPCPAARLEAEMAECGLTAVGLQLENLATGAELLGRPVTFGVVTVDGGRLAVRSNQIDVTLAIVDQAKKEAFFHGLSTVRRIERLVAKRFPGRVNSKIVAETLRLIDGLCWLEREGVWFRIASISKHGLPKTIDKVLAVAGQVTVAELRRAMSRNRRLWREAPPESVLLEFCRQMPGVHVDNGRIVSEVPRDWRTALTGIEAKLVEVLKTHGPVMERGALEDLCVAAGMNRFSFHAFVSWSPVIAQFGHSVYGLLGTRVSKRKVEALTAARRAERSTHRVLDEHGQTEDGKVWLSYRLSKAASTYAVITVPAALKKVVQGRFTLLSPEGTKIGTLATKDGRAWGLGAFLRHRGARIGDHITVTLDMTNRTATVSWSENPQHLSTATDQPS